MHDKIKRLYNEAWKKCLWTLLGVALIAFLSLLVLSGLIKLSVRERIVNQESGMPTGCDCIVVLGCGVKADGTPSDMLHDRLMTAIALYRSGAAPKILLTGDGEGEDYNETRVMRAFCIEQGVPEEALLTDRYGLSTYDSIWRLRLYGIERPVIVTQKYHLYRALYIAGRGGINAVGVSADLRSYRGGLYRGARELLARLKDFYMAQLWPKPVYTQLD